MGVKLNEFKMDIEKLDLHGFFGLNPDVRPPGYWN